MFMYSKSERNTIRLILILVVTALIGVAFIPTINPTLATNINLPASVQTDNPALIHNMNLIFDTFKFERAVIILAMLMVGIGFLMVFARKHGYSSVTATFLAMSAALPLYMLIKGSTGRHAYSLIELFLLAEFAAAGLLITMGAAIGKLKIEQYFFMALLFLPAYMANEWLISESGRFAGFIDTGGAVTLHAFAAYFGLGMVANTSNEFKNGPVCETGYISNLFCLLGGLILWVFWPAFNSALVSPDRVVITGVNTVFALCGSTVSTYVLSMLIRGKIEVMDIANAALAGGVSISTLCNLTNPGYSLLIGIAAGILATAGFAIIAPKVEHFIKGSDTGGIHSLHGIPGIFGGLTGLAVTDACGIQLAGILISVAIAFACGKITGSILNLLGTKQVPFSDEEEFFVPPQTQGQFRNH